MTKLISVIATALAVAFFMISPVKANVPMPHTIVLILCKTEPSNTKLSDIEDSNARFTGSENRQWAYEHSKMQCRREQLEIYDAAVDQGADPKALTTTACWRSALMLGVQWNMQHRNSAYRFWRAACPVPTIRKNPDGSETIIAWTLPDCGHRETVQCEKDIVI